MNFTVAGFVALRVPCQLTHVNLFEQPKRHPKNTNFLTPPFGTMQGEH